MRRRRRRTRRDAGTGTRGRSRGRSSPGLAGSGPPAGRSSEARHRVAVAVRHEHRHVQGTDPLEQCVMGDTPVQTASYCASRVAHVVASSRSSVLAYMRRSACWPAFQAGGRRGEEHDQVCLGPGLRCADRADDLGRPAMHAGRALGRRGRENQPADDGGQHQRDLLRDEAADGEPSRSTWLNSMAARNATASRAICSMVSAVVPVEPPTPALSNVTTRRAGASASISAGSQLSRFPRKCWSRTSGNPSSPPPVSR